MKEKMVRFLKNYRKAFVPDKNHLRKECAGVCEAVNKKLAETNCRRIVAISPILLVLYAVSTIMLIVCRNVEYFMVSMIVTSILVFFTIVMDAVICWIMFFNKIDNSKEVWKFKLIYRLFWPVWFGGMVILSCIQIENGRIGILLIVTCLISNLLP
ncbi:MAG: hypothetical protein PUA75_03090 [Clostridiales bacterium]|nr:hypothetical protein [Clostridiales bacterium]